MPPSFDRPVPPAPDPGRLRQIKLHEMALAYAGVLQVRIEKQAAELAGEMRRLTAPAPIGAGGWEQCFRRYLAGTVHAVMTEQCGDSASPFVRAVCGAYAEDLERTGAGVDKGEAYSALPAAAGKIAGERIGRLIALTDLRGAEGVCWELLTGIFRWDGRRFVIGPQRIAEAQSVIDGYLAALRSGTAPADGTATVKDALKLALTVCLFRREPSPGTVARLKEGYASLGSLPSSRKSPSLPFPRAIDGREKPFRGLNFGENHSLGVGRHDLDRRAEEARRELAEEIDMFCRTLAVLREAAELPVAQ